MCRRRAPDHADRSGGGPFWAASASSFARMIACRAGLAALYAAKNSSLVIDSPFVALFAAARLVSRDVTSITVADSILAARCSGVPFFDRRGMTTRSTAGPAFAARSSGVPFLELRGLLAAARFAARLLAVFAVGNATTVMTAPVTPQSAR
jgi:hypothetical protein